jgi:3-hydroxyacyl-CoA dehydrogenase
VIGAGTMGSGVAQVNAAAGYRVVIQYINSLNDFRLK